MDQLQVIVSQTIENFDSSLKKPQLQYYKEGQLLVVTGQQRAIEVVTKIVRALPGQHNSWNADTSVKERELQKDKALMEALSRSGAPVNKP